jgi:hypothetical protein
MAEPAAEFRPDCHCVTPVNGRKERGTGGWKHMRERDRDIVDACQLGGHRHGAQAMELDIIKPIAYGAIEAGVVPSRR